ncbi:K(+)-transporting ATPase subunit F [bacterium]|nr:K(+)-transporting ATPase subunit F [bacterium]
MLYIVTTVFAFCLGYLVYAILRPERF